MRKPDRRMEKMRQAIFQALTDLMQEKKYSHITIQEIIDRANVGRTTFYAHYTAKDDLLVACIDHIFDSLNQHLLDCAADNKSHMRPIPVSELLSHIKDNSQLIKGMMNAESSDLLFDKFKSYWNKNAKEYLVGKIQDGTGPKIPMEILVNHITSTLIELIKWWVGTDMKYTPKQMEQYYEELILPCIVSVIETK